MTSQKPLLIQKIFLLNSIFQLYASWQNVKTMLSRKINLVRPSNQLHSNRKAFSMLRINRRIKNFILFTPKKPASQPVFCRFSKFFGKMEIFRF